MSEACKPCAMLLQGFSYFDRQPVVYFACEGHNQRFVQGLNAAQPCWDEPPVHGVPKFLQARQHALMLIA